MFLDINEFLKIKQMGTFGHFLIVKIQIIYVPMLFFYVPVSIFYVPMLIFYVP